MQLTFRSCSYCGESEKIGGATGSDCVRNISLIPFCLCDLEGQTLLLVNHGAGNCYGCIVGFHYDEFHYDFDANNYFGCSAGIHGRGVAGESGSLVS